MQLPKLLPTTVVGSFPCVKRPGLSALFDPYKKAVQFAVAGQLRAGVDIISDGQVRADMVQAFVSKLSGINGNMVTRIISTTEKTITVADTRYALTQTKYVKGILTGPCTLAYALKIATPAYRSRDELVLDLAAILHSEAKILAANGVYMIQVDEPILSTGAMDMKTAKEALQTIFRDITTPSCIHTCGRLNTISSEWTRLPVDVIDFEYSASPDNLSDISRHDLRNKKIGCGCVKSSYPEVEPVEEIEKRILSCVEVLGAENILIDPDCGLRMLTPEVAFAKLANMCEAVKNVRAEL
ncbi:MAG TPA: methionine synthase [Methanocorpusculum sp.]|nr:methionine synthase [Methanocorpusculum sp.]